MPLTAEECRIAAERAKTYPKGFGSRYLGLQLTRAEAIAAGVPPHTIDTVPFETPGATLAWLKRHPEDLALGCPSVAVAEHRGQLTDGELSLAFDDVVDATTSQSPFSGKRFCLLLDTDPLEVARRLEKAAGKMTNPKEVKNDTDC